jgi:hypothetical protein
MPVAPSGAATKKLSRRPRMMGRVRAQELLEDATARSAGDVEGARARRGR